ncbi:MAG: 3-oxoadipyl-CoA thiolase [Pseudomonadota bacterium]
MSRAFICDGIRTPFGRYGGALSSIRTDDLAALPIAEILSRHTSLDRAAVDEVVLGCAIQAGEDNRNVARMASLLAGLPPIVPGITVNRLCASGLEAAVHAARSIKLEAAELMIAGGVESMSRAPLVMSKADKAYGRTQRLEDSTLGWRFVNPKMESMYGVDSMAQTAENVAEAFSISREDQDKYACRSQLRVGAAVKNALFDEEIFSVRAPVGKSGSEAVSQDEHPRPETTLEQLSALKPAVSEGGCVTAGNASGVNDGSAALLIASETALGNHGLTPLAEIKHAVSTGVEPRLMGIGPVSAVNKLLQRTNLTLDDIGVLEINEAFAAQVLAVTRQLGLPDDCEHVNPNGGAIAIGHPLGASGARLLLTASLEMKRRGVRFGICSMCVGVGQGVAVLLKGVS